MVTSKLELSSASRIPFKSKNKQKRSAAYQRVSRAKESVKRDQRFRRKREELKNPKLRTERLGKNIPASIDRKRVWDEVNDDEDGDGLGLSVDVEKLKKRKVEEPTDEQKDDGKDGLTESKLKKLDEESGKEDASIIEEDEDGQSGSNDDDLASLMEDSDADSEAGSVVDAAKDSKDMPPPSVPERSGSPAASTTSTNLSLIPDALAAKFPTLFKPPETPKILITTSLHGTVHEDAKLLTSLFPNSHYVRRTRHRWNSHQFSLREIAKFASNREYTMIVVMEEDHKRPSGLTMIHLPVGPTFHFTIRNWIEGKKLPGHGNPTGHQPELILNNFRTPLGLLTAHMFRALFPPQPQLEGRQVVTLHNQRDYIFVRRHRYIFRDKRGTEKPVVGTDGKPMKGAEDIRAGLQELGPRFTLKLRRIDKGIQRASGQEWEWKTRMEKQRTKFQL